MPIRGLLAKKIGMTRVFLDKGQMVPVTVLQAGPVQVVQKKTPAKEGYAAVQIAFEEIAEKRVNKPDLGRFKKANVAPRRFLKEYRLEKADEYQVGDVVKVDIFNEGEMVDVTGVSKGKGFAGGIKRHHWQGGPATRGSRFHRAPGSIGANSTPSEVSRGHNMPGHMGNETVTVQSLKVIRVDVEKNLLLVKGAVPGANNGLVSIKKSVKAKLKPGNK